ncbi:hypothetical protein CRG98_014523 [Punica granatum]|uniref:Uncharacterized protein n=1 Tax=Punica granatum TaxID=22663 RepID=A0A2I0K941_PUNGR|nr:hypothetical protein CRG98_014523 [Punica granatum]
MKFESGSESLAHSWFDPPPSSVEKKAHLKNGLRFCVPTWAHTTTVPVCRVQPKDTQCRGRAVEQGWRSTSFEVELTSSSSEVGEGSTIEGSRVTGWRLQSRGRGRGRTVEVTQVRSPSSRCCRPEQRKDSDGGFI